MKTDTVFHVAVFHFIQKPGEHSENDFETQKIGQVKTKTYS